MGPAIFTEVMIRMGQEASTFYGSYDMTGAGNTPILKEVMTRTGQEAPPFLWKL